MEKNQEEGFYETVNQVQERLRQTLKDESDKQNQKENENELFNYEVGFLVVELMSNIHKMHQSAKFCVSEIRNDTLQYFEHGQSELLL